MRVVVLISGGKDSCYNMMQAHAEGHKIVALANLHPKDKDELDSYMYQTVGHQGIEKLAKAMDIPLYRRETKGHSVQLGKNYVPTESDEVEDLYDLLKCTKDELNIEAVACGAIFSDYQRVRVENVCNRLKLISLTYLWRRDQKELLQEMIDCHIHAIIIKVASLGLYPDRHLGKSIKEIQPHLIEMQEKYGLNICGEGGEYETFTLDCPLFKQKIVIDDMQIIVSSSDNVCPVGYINFTKLHLEPKNNQSINNYYVKKSLDYITDLNESTLSDLSDPDLSDLEIEAIKNERKIRISLSKDDLTLKEQANIRSNSLIPSSSLSSESISSLVKNPLIFQNETKPIPNIPVAIINSKGWCWIAGINGYGTSSRNGMIDALEKLKKLANDNSYQLYDICYVTLYIRNMQEYTEINDVYTDFIKYQNPPTRICVQCPLPENCHVIIEAVAHRNYDGGEIDYKRTSMHVSSISHWAPSNIGQYSQATIVEDIIYISGQIGLIPGNMKLINGGIKQQCQLTLRHLSRIAEAMNAQFNLRKVVQGICFVTHPSYINEARIQWERRTTNAIIDYIVVPSLPRSSLVEFQVWAHMHNLLFDYEETGCAVGLYTISIRRRWNFENNCAAIVCYVSTSAASSNRNQQLELAPDVIFHHCQLARNLTSENIIDILTYTLNKLLKDFKTKDSELDIKSKEILPAIHMRIFYQVMSDVPTQLLTNSLQIFTENTKNIATLAFTLIPACSLHNFNTFLSICGLRYE